MSELELRELIKKTSYPYLAAFDGEWINADREIMSFDEMRKEHLKNSLRMLKEQKYSIEHGFFLQGVKFDKSKYDEIVRMTIELYYKKIKELEDYIKLNT